ncbi:hypothetical protein [Bradyrhizobium australafricanum]|uniref:hypothetical protein n=1 Tax=Bradyrhizobium australafricanum TaxID=2821406 RepID=UPI001CE37226|nr:hypothetical protein [Bradyrhizobium australafricanum]MCA6101035.1 hypothetical protein [Bradyrhizobium australafricanum]
MAKHNKPGADQDWWTIWPEFFDAELAAFARLRIEPRTVHKGNGILILEADWPVDGQSASMLLRIGYSPLHPFFRPTVAAPNESFERHQNPISRELCLLTQESEQWESNQFVADFVQERLNHLLRALAARKEGRWNDAAKLEEQAADPLMPYCAGASERTRSFVSTAMRRCRPGRTVCLRWSARLAPAARTTPRSKACCGN